MPTAAEQLIGQIATAFGHSVTDMVGRSRRADIVRARHAAMYAVRQHTGLSYPAIGRLFNRDHTTVIHAVTRIEGARRVNHQLDQLLEDVA